MREILDFSEINWITNRIFPKPQEKEWRYGQYKFGHVIPQGFEAYCKILSSIFEDLNIENKMQSWNDVEYLSAESKVLNSRDVLRGINFNGQRILFKELAREYKIPYTHQILDELHINVFNRNWRARYVVTSEGEMDFETAKNLSNVLSRFTEDNKYYFSFWGREKGLQVLEGDITDGLMTIDSRDYVSGNDQYWWAKDKSWCVALGCDSEFSLCGASLDVINALVNAPELECFRIDINDNYC
jgi:hypothetical protein